MFKGAYLFDQNLESWNLSSITEHSEPGTNNSRYEMINMLDSCAMSIPNYEATLLGWATNPATPDSIDLGSRTLQYCDETGRDILLSKGWVITGDSKADDIECMPSSTASVEDNSISIFPNPSDGKFSIVGLSQGSYYYEVIALSGKKVVAGPISNGKVNLTIPKGLYLLKISSQEKSYTRKLVIE